MIEAAVLDPSDADSAVVHRCEAWLAFQRRFAFEPQRGTELLAVHPDPRVALARAGLLVDVATEASAGDRASLARRGIRILAWPCQGYPPMLRMLVDAPPVLCVRGDVRSLSWPAVAIVGARAATVEGLDTAYGLGAALAERGLVVVSGLARGIDAAAHRGALEAGGVTVAIQACGADRVYPAEHRDLAHAIAASGAVVSELPVGSPPRRAHFPLRNRLISGLSLATVIVEARLRSGSLVTAAHALGQGREVLAVPGPLRAPTSEGPNRLLRDGARPLLDVDDVLCALPDPVVDGLRRASEPRDRDGGGARLRRAEPTPSGAAGDGAAPAESGVEGHGIGRGRSRARHADRTDHQGAACADDPTVRGGAGPGSDRPDRALRRRLDDRDRLLLDELDRCAQRRDGLVRALGWTVSEVTARLLALEVDGRVHQDRDGRFKRRREIDLRSGRRASEAGRGTKGGGLR